MKKQSDETKKQRQPAQKREPDKRRSKDLPADEDKRGKVKGGGLRVKF